MSVPTPATLPKHIAHIHPRILISTPVIDWKLYALDDYLNAIRSQETECGFDVLWLDNTPVPKPGYREWLDGLPRSRTFGRGHRFRIARFGEDVDGSRFRHPHYQVAVAHQMAWERFQRWSHARKPADRYDALLYWEIDVIPDAHAIQTLWESGLPWAAAWMTTRGMIDQRKGGVEVKELPLVWRGLTPQTWAGVTDWDELVPLGYMEPPGPDPFPCSATHLGLTMIRREVTDRVAFQLTTAGGDTGQSWAVAAAGFPVMCVPAVRPEHVTDWDADRWSAGARGKAKR